MKVHRLLAMVALLITACGGTLAAVTDQQKREHLRILRTQAFKRGNISPLEAAYLDAFNLLQQRASCAEFFGDSGSAVALEALVIDLREERINDSGLGIRMSGAFRMFANAESDFSYRLFASARLNTEGPFYRSKVFPADPFVPRVGSFQPNTRQARVLILLHELAHLIQGNDGTWLIPDDGNNPTLSRQNTVTVESQCGKQIRAL